MNDIISKEERAAILALNSIFGFSPQKGRAILQNLEDPREIFFVDRCHLQQIGIRNEHQLNQLTPFRLRKAIEELDYIDSMQGHFITLKDPSYPSLLRECPDAPIGLYLKSQDLPDHLFSEEIPAIAIVGTRDISPYGREICTQLVRQLARMTPQPLIVSGLALGVDITAHQAALENGLPTLAVMATGIDQIYPFSHGWAASKISQTKGSGLLSDYPPKTRPQAINFIRRNRIMAGMCIATILIESKIKGGGLITARLASSYNREVYAVPGRIKDVRSQGCNYLIAKNIATPLIDPEQLIHDLGFTVSVPSSGPSLDITRRINQTYEGKQTNEDLRLLHKIICQIQLATEINQESLAHYCKIPYPKLLYLTELLESDGFIQIDLLHNCSIHKDFV